MLLSFVYDYLQPIQADGGGAQTIRREAGCRHALCDDPVHETVATIPAPYLKMDGHAVSAFAVRKLDEVIRQFIALAGFGSGLTWAGRLSRWPYP